METALLHTAIGKVEQTEGGIYVLTAEGDAGCVLYGPYRVLEPGSYEVAFHAMPRAMGGDVCCVVDVLRRGRTIVAEKDFTADELAHRNGYIPVRFEVVEQDSFEFRLTATGSAALTVRYERPLRRLDAANRDGQG